ncbi:hypothetical protein SLEP1_g21486 [Rubroshorea leprosula]|uniref:Uncharacterized protein n=1 Tax=Rubroshorea leprosula TaxID=152421 RepID=A0AAV5JEV3_9ROSI|nr:hypothetical protein SLEP1_g21486 [Rubroshorea leprosula]
MANTNTLPASIPSNYGKPYHAEAPIARKLGKHRHKVVKPSSNPPLLAPETGAILQSVEESSGTSADPTSSVDGSGKGQEVHLEMHHSSVDKSIAGGGVILGCLVTVFLVAVFRYIRATGRHKLEAKSSSSGISS